MNRAGVAVGHVYGSTGLGQLAVVWPAAGTAPLILPLPPGGGQSIAQAINDAGIIAGIANSGTTPASAAMLTVLWIPRGGAYDVVELGAGQWPSLTEPRAEAGGKVALMVAARSNLLFKITLP